ncbi:MAG: bacillithiol biosynthesis BshC [Planctomycetota bacterium]
MTSLQHLSADVFGLSPVARKALAAGRAFGPIPVATRITDVPRPDEFLGVDERNVLIDHIDRGLEGAGIGLPPAARDGLEALREEGTACVVTGQQPGFLSSPLYSLYKALQACRAAKELSETWGAPVVPVFWNHADDHDVAEVHHAWQLNRNLDLQKVSLAGLSSGRTPLGDLPIDAEAQRLEAVRAQLRGIVEEHPGADAALDLFLPRDGETLVRAMTRAFTELCGVHGLIVCEPQWIRPMLSSELGRIVSSPAGEATLADALRRGEDDLRALGLEPAIPVGDEEAETHAALVYRIDRPEGGGLPERIAVRAGGEGFRVDGEPGSCTPAELGSLVVGATDDWSAGALVRPLVQDAVFPTCAYVGGLGELGYHAQLGPARDAVGQPRTPFLPRVSITLVDADTRYALGRVDSDVETVLRAMGRFGAEDDDALADPPVVDALRAVGVDAAEKMLEHRAELAELEPALAVTLKKTADHVQQSIGKVIDKALRVHKNRAGKGARQVRRVNGTLVPRDQPQERVLGPFQFVARYGAAFVDALWSEMPAVSTEHLVLHLEDGDEAEGR